MAALDSQGVTLSRGDGGGVEVFNPIGQITGWSGPNSSMTVIDITDLDSTAKEKKGGLIDEGQVTAELNLDTNDAEQLGLRADMKGKVLRNFELNLNDVAATVAAFSALVVGFSITGAVDDKVTASLTLEISGSVTGW